MEEIRQRFIGTLKGELRRDNNQAKLYLEFLASGNKELTYSIGEITFTLNRQLAKFLLDGLIEDMEFNQRQLESLESRLPSILSDFRIMELMAGS